MNPTSFERALEAAMGLPNTKTTRPVTKLATLAIIGSVTTYIVQSHRDESGGITTYLQVAVDGGLHQVIIPPDVTAIMERQRASLKDRSTPASRQRKASAIKRAKAKKIKAENAAEYGRRQALKAGCTPESAEWVAQQRRKAILDGVNDASLSGLIASVLNVQANSRPLGAGPRTDIAHAKRRGE